MGAVRVDCAEPEGACAALGAALDSARALGYPPGITRAGALRMRMPSPWDTLACVRGLDEQLRAVA